MGSVALVQRTSLEVPTWLEIVVQADADVLVMVPRAVSLVRELREGLGAVLERLGVRRKERRVGERCANRPAL